MNLFLLLATAAQAYERRSTRREQVLDISIWFESINFERADMSGFSAIPDHLFSSELRPFYSFTHTAVHLFYSVCVAPSRRLIIFLFWISYHIVNYWLIEETQSFTYHETKKVTRRLYAWELWNVNKLTVKQMVCSIVHIARVNFGFFVEIRRTLTWTTHTVCARAAWKRGECGRYCRARQRENKISHRHMDKLSSNSK